MVRSPKSGVNFLSLGEHLSSSHWLPCKPPAAGFPFPCACRMPARRHASGTRGCWEPSASYCVLACILRT